MSFCYRHGVTSQNVSKTLRVVISLWTTLSTKNSYHFSQRPRPQHSAVGFHQQTFDHRSIVVLPINLLDEFKFHMSIKWMLPWWLADPTNCRSLLLFPPPFFFAPFPSSCSPAIFHMEEQRMGLCAVGPHAPCQRWFLSLFPQPHSSCETASASYETIFIVTLRGLTLLMGTKSPHHANQEIIINTEIQIHFRQKTLGLKYMILVKGRARIKMRHVFIVGIHI